MTDILHKSLRQLTALTVTAGLLAVCATPAEARRCGRLTKTEGALVGGGGGAVLGGVLSGSATGAVVGAVAGGVAGHEIARTRHHRCYVHHRR